MSSLLLPSNTPIPTNPQAKIQISSRSRTDSPPKSQCLNWITALAIVKFDINQGNLVEDIFPSNILSKEELKTISLLSFPDSNSFSAEGALKFVFRLPKDKSHADSCFNSLYGYVYFRQMQDPTNPRGFSQESFVLLSTLPFSNFYKRVLDAMGSYYFDEGKVSDAKLFMRSTYNTIANKWPKPQAGSYYKVNMYGKEFAVLVPKNLSESKHVSSLEQITLDSSQEDQNSNTTAEQDFVANEEAVNSPIDNEEEDQQVLCKESNDSISTGFGGLSFLEKTCFQDINLYKIFKGDRLPYLWSLWELALTGQPLMIASDLPSECSEAVLGLLSTIYPLEYQSDYKPYLTIYDPDFREIQSLYDQKMAKCGIIGVTNPLFLKRMEAYPNIFHLEKDYLKQKKSQTSKKVSLLQSTNKTYTLPDPNLEKMFLKADNEEAYAINNALIRKSLQSLTESFLATFQIYFKLQINDIKKFEEKDFMKFLELQKFPFKSHYASQVHIKKVYQNFLKSANFQSYIKSLTNVYITKSL